MLVALLISAFQLGALMMAASLRGSHFHTVAAASPAAA